MPYFSQLHPEDFTLYRSFHRLFEKVPQKLKKINLRHRLERETNIHKSRLLTGLFFLSRYPLLYGNFNALEYIAEAFYPEGRRNRNLEIWFRNWRGKHQKIVGVTSTRKIERQSEVLCNNLKITPIGWEEAPEGVIIPLWEGGGQIVFKENSRRLRLSRNLYRLRNPRELGWQNAFDLMALTGETGRLAERVYETLGKETIIKMLDEVLFPPIHRLLHLLSESNLKNKVIAEKTSDALELMRSTVVRAIEREDPVECTTSVSAVLMEILRREDVELKYIGADKWVLTCIYCGTDNILTAPFPEKTVCRNCRRQYKKVQG